MKIALLSPPWLPLPPHGYGGIENVVFNLGEGLRKKGHSVFIYSTGDSVLSPDINLMYHFKRSLGIDVLLEKEHVLFLLAHVHQFLKNLPIDIDIIHNHCEYAAMYLLDNLQIPFVHTLHGAFYQTFNQDRESKDHAVEAYIETLMLFKNHPFVSISNSQRKSMPDLNYIQTVYNGSNIEDFVFSDKPSDYIAWVGRYSPLKGLNEGIEVARRLRKKMTVAASIHKKREEQFNKEIRPLLTDDLFSFLGEAKNSEKNTVFANAKLFIFPIQWEEPFGLVLIESMASGTPVVAYARGSVPEITKDGETGFLINPSETDKRGNWIIKKTGIDGLCEAVERIYSMPEPQYRQMRKACREQVEKYFTVEKMVENYEKTYLKIKNTST